MSLIPVNERLASIEALVRAQAQEIKLLTSRLARSAEGRNPRLAITVAHGESYPTRAEMCNTYWIRFVDASHAATGPEESTLTIDERSSGTPRVLATNIHPDPFVPEGTLLKVFWDNNRWWFEYSDRIIRVRLLSTLTAGGSVPCQWQVSDGAGGYEDAPGDPIDVYDDLSTSMTGITNHIGGAHWDRDSQRYWFVQKEC